MAGSRVVDELEVEDWPLRVELTVYRLEAEARLAAVEVESSLLIMVLTLNVVVVASIASS